MVIDHGFAHLALANPLADKVIETYEHAIIRRVTCNMTSITIQSPKPAGVGLSILASHPKNLAQLY